MLALNIILDEQIIQNVYEYNALGVVVHGLTPRMKVNIRERLTTLIDDLLNNSHPIILKRLVLTIMQSLDSSIIGLLTIRPKDSFIPSEIKNFLYTHLEWLLDVDHHSPSMLGDYIIVDEENTLDNESEIHEVDE
jgi:hypothetical protein